MLWVIVIMQYASSLDKNLWITIITLLFYPRSITYCRIPLNRLCPLGQMIHTAGLFSKSGWIYLWSHPLWQYYCESNYLRKWPTQSHMLSPFSSETAAEPLKAHRLAYTRQSCPSTDHRRNAHPFFQDSLTVAAALKRFRAEKPLRQNACTNGRWSNVGSSPGRLDSFGRIHGSKAITDPQRRGGERIWPSWWSATSPWTDSTL